MDAPGLVPCSRPLLLWGGVGRARKGGSTNDLPDASRGDNYLPTYASDSFGIGNADVPSLRSCVSGSLLAVHDRGRLYRHSSTPTVTTLHLRPTCQVTDRQCTEGVLTGTARRPRPRRVQTRTCRLPITDLAARKTPLLRQRSRLASGSGSGSGSASAGLTICEPCSSNPPHCPAALRA